MLRVTTSLVIGVLVAMAVLGVGPFVARLIESRFPPEVTDGFTLLLYPLGALAGSVVVKRRHPRARLAAMITYFVAAMLLAGYAMFFITALIFGVDL